MCQTSQPLYFILMKALLFSYVSDSYLMIYEQGLLICLSASLVIPLLYVQRRGAGGNTQWCTEGKTANMFHCDFCMKITVKC